MKPHKPDYILLATTLLLIISGLVILTSASSAISYENFKNTSYYLVHQLIYGVVLGTVLAIAVYKIDYRKWKKISLATLIVSIILLLLVFLPSTSLSHGGAKRWINIPLPVLGNFSFQAAEFAKLAFVIYLAAWLEKREKVVRSFGGGFVPFALMLGIISLLLIAQPDIGTLFIIALSAMVVFFLGGAKIKHIVLLVGLGALAFAIMLYFKPYTLNRLLVFLNPGFQPQGIGYQINQALLAIGSGGIFGRGFGASRQKYDYLPESMGDSVFAIVGEEFGFIGAIFIISLFFIFAWRGFKTAQKSSDTFGTLLAGGITSIITFQAFINIAAITSLLPLTGVPLPFISYGGSSMIIFLIATGILLNISRYTKQ